MAISNIIDHRKRPYRFAKINAVVEAAWHDNRVKDADQSPSDDGPSYDEREHVSFGDAVIWGQAFPTPITLYIYDEDSGIYPNGERKDDES